MSVAAMIPGGRLSADGRSVVVDLVPGTPETGLWCGSCLLPSGVRVPVYVLTSDGPRPFAPGAEVRVCTECGQRL